MYNELLLAAGGGITSKNQFSPQMGEACVMIGIGGTGLAALRKVKKAVYQHLEPDDPKDPIPKYEKIRFLAIDTDTTDLQKGSADASELQPDEQFSVNIPSLTELLAQPHLLGQSAQLNWMSKKGIAMQGTEGAGGIRQVGRYCLFQRAVELKNKIAAMVAAAKTAAGKPDVNIHIFAGISGGTGSGCFLDTCYIAREAMNGSGRIMGYFFLPDIQLNRPGIQGNTAIENYNKKNGYAAFRELDYLMSLKSSNEWFDQNYGEFRIRTQDPPADMCHLISGTNSQGILIPDAYEYGMGVVSDYVLSFMSKVEDGQGGATLGKNDGGLTLQGHMANIGQALNQLKPEYGAERQYHILGASSAELPLTHIGTYLASRTYEKLMPNVGRHSSMDICAYFANNLGFTMEGMLDRLSAGANLAPAFNVDGMDRPRKLNDGDDNWNISTADITTPLEQCWEDAMAAFDRNYRAETQELESYDVVKCQQVQDPTFAVKLFSFLAQVAQSAQYGPTVAAELLHAEGSVDFEKVFDGIITELKTHHHYLYNQRDLQEKQIVEMARAYNKSISILGSWKKHMQDYLNARTAYLQNEIRQEQCRRAISMLAEFKKISNTLYTQYFSPLRDMVDELAETFSANLRWLSIPANLNDNSFCWRIFQLNDVKATLDERLKQQQIEVEQADLMNFLFNSYGEWRDRHPYRIGRCVNAYMREHFSSILSRTIDDFLGEKYNTQSPAVLASNVQTDILRELKTKAAPLFYKSKHFQIIPTTTVSKETLTFPVTSPAISQAAANEAKNNLTVNARPCFVSDRISWLSFVSGVPLYAYQGVYALKGLYDKSPDRGAHLHEEDINWRHTLPTPIPYRLDPSATPEGTEKAALYNLAVEKGIISAISPQMEEEYIIRKLDDTTPLVSGYVKSRYYNNGIFQQNVLQQHIAALEQVRAGLLPEDVRDKNYPTLKNDGRNVNGGADLREDVRRDYFIRFGGLQAVAKASLAELQRVDDKIAEMKGWIADQQKGKVKATRYLRLRILERLQISGAKVNLDVEYQGLTRTLELCKNTSPYALLPEYQAYASLNECEQDGHDGPAIRALDAEMEDIFENIDLGTKRAIINTLAANYSKKKLVEVSNRTAGDPSQAEIVDFYKTLVDLIAEQVELLNLLGDTESERKQKSEPEPVPVPVPSDMWTCACGSKNKGRFCMECGKPKPVPVPSDMWTCACGSKNKGRFCMECGKPKPVPVPSDMWICTCGGRNKGRFCMECGSPRPVAAPPAPKNWNCPDCGARYDAVVRFCPECGIKRPW